MRNILAQLESTNSSKEKVKILENLSEADAKMFRRIAFLAYDPSIDFYIKTFELSEEFDGVLALENALTDLENIIAKRVFTGNMAKKWIEENYSMLSEDDAEVFRRVVIRDLRCGVTATTTNKVWPDTVYQHPYMRCSSFSEKNLSKITYPCYSQTKMDGLYCDTIVRVDSETLQTTVEYRSRNGSYIELGSDDRNELLIKHIEGYVMMGEALAVDKDGVLMNRQASNGYLNSNAIDPERIVFYAWDLVDIDSFDNRKSTEPYEDRLQRLCDVAESVPFVEVVSTVVCENKDDILDHFREMREVGEEGTIIKNKDLIWKPGSSKDQIKCKVIFDCDLVAKEWKYGEGKHEGLVGSIRFETSDGALSVWVGGGYKDTMRKSLLETIDQHISDGMVATVRGNDVISNRDDPDLYSIFLPRFVEFRTDKDEADDVDRVKEQVKSFTDALDQIK